MGSRDLSWFPKKLNETQLDDSCSEKEKGIPFYEFVELLQEIPESDSREVEPRKWREGPFGLLGLLQMAEQGYGLLDRHTRWPGGSVNIIVTHLLAEEECREVTVSSEW